MSELTEILDRWKADAEAVIAEGKQKLETDLPKLATLVQGAETNPLIAAGLNVLHLSPEFLSQLASVILAADQKLGEAKAAQAAADAAQAAALAAADPAPAEPGQPAEEVPAA
jgi:hypothetical protein